LQDRLPARTFGIAGDKYRPPIALVVSPDSVFFIRYVVDYIKKQLAEYSPGGFSYHVCNDLAEFRPPDGSIVFLVGDGLRLYRHDAAALYVFINFSLLYRLVPWHLTSLAGYAWLRGKHKRFAEQVSAFDMVLDFHVRQTRLLTREFGKLGPRFRSFMTDVLLPAGKQERATPLDEKEWDVCLVGSASPRRLAVRRALLRSGLRLSPDSVHDLHETIRDSRIVLNVHYARCDTLEAPRIIHALATGSCLVTEECLGLEQIAPSECYVSVRYARLADTVRSLLDEPTAITRIGEEAATHMRKNYSVAAKSDWQTIAGDVTELARTKTT
jgi:hypothetical protein